MSSWITDEKGYWHPAKEKVGLTNHGAPFKNEKTGEMVNTGDPYIYEGPCRAALFDLWNIDKTGKTTTLGMDFKTNTDFLECYGRARSTLGFKDIPEYLNYLGFNEEEIKKRFDENSSVVKKHELPKRIEQIQRLGGGRDHSGQGNDTYGNFGSPAELAKG